MIELSIVIATYNCKDKIIELVNSLINQNVNFKYEIVIVDDFSVDWTRKILKNLRKLKKIKIFFNEKNYWNWYSKNLGFKNSKWSICFFIDDHCIIKDKLFISKIKNSFDKNNVDWICWYYESLIPNDKNIFRDIRRINIYKKIKWEEFLIQNTTFSIVIWWFRRKILEKYNFPINFWNLSCEDTFIQLEIQKDWWSLYFDWNINCYHDHGLWIKDIYKKIIIEAKWVINLYKHMFLKGNFDLPYIKFYLDGIFIDIFIILILFYVQKIFWLIFFAIFLYYRYFRELINITNIKIKIEFLFFLIAYDFIKLFNLIFFKLFDYNFMFKYLLCEAKWSLFIKNILWIKNIYGIHD